MEKESELHPIFVHDPEEWMQYVYKKISVVTGDDKEHEGWVYTVDPVSQNFVLVQFASDRTQMSIVMQDAIIKTTVLAESNPSIKEKLDALFRPSAEVKLSAEELKARKLKLKLWLEKNRLPVQVTGSQEEVLTITDALTIQPPYGVNDCHSTNEIILGHIQGLIKNMPEDHDQWWKEKKVVRQHLIPKFKSLGNVLLEFVQRKSLGVMTVQERLRHDHDDRKHKQLNLQYFFFRGKN